MAEKVNELSLSDIFGAGYKGFTDAKQRYRILIGGRASKKSKSTALDYIIKIMLYEGSNLLCIRKVFKDHRDSTYAELKWAIGRLGVEQHWKCSVNPFEITYLPTGQKILFRGLDDPQSITSITVANGNLCWCWFEEAFQISAEQDFNMVDGSIRGLMPEHLFKQITLTMNPWNERHWIKKKFWDQTDKPIETKSGEGWEYRAYEDVFLSQTNHLCNEWLDEKDRKFFEDIKTKNPRRYWVEGLGNWGVAEGLIFNNWEEFNFDYREILRSRKNAIAVFGLDFGYTNDPTGFIASVVDLEKRELFIFDEFYEYGFTNLQTAKEIKSKGYFKEKIVADSGEPKSIDELKKNGIVRIRGARKGADSINNGIQFLLQFKIYVHPSCKWTNYELNNYAWDTRNGKKINEPIKDFNHLIDPLRYSVEEFSRVSGIRFFNTRRERLN